jgi:tetratricopeptide (TPR) repeat protein
VLTLFAGCTREEDESTNRVSRVPSPQREPSQPEPSQPEPSQPEPSQPSMPSVEDLSPEDSDASEPQKIESMDAASSRQAGLLAIQNGDSDAAYDYARQAMRLDPENPQVVFLMAMVLAERHRFPEAIEMLEEVAATTPEARLPAMGQTADWLVRFGQWEKAEARYLELLRQVPDAVLVHRNLAKLLLRQGRRLDAALHLNQLCLLGDITENELRSMLMTAHPFAGDANAPSFEPIGAQGMARSEIARGDWRAARDRLLDLKSTGPWESALLGRAHAMLENPDSLRNWVREMDDAVDVSPDAWFAKGVYAASTQQEAEANRCFAEAILLDPTDHEAYSRLAGSLTASGETAEAASLERRAELIERTQGIGQQMAGTVDRDQASMLQLIDMLQQLHRPLEALGWRGVMLMYVDTESDSGAAQAQQVLDEIVKERTLLLKGNQHKASPEFVLCGIDLQKLPSREEVNKRLKSWAMKVSTEE